MYVPIKLKELDRNRDLCVVHTAAINRIKSGASVVVVLCVYRSHGLGLQNLDGKVKENSPNVLKQLQSGCI